MCVYGFGYKRYSVNCSLSKLLSRNNPCNPWVWRKANSCRKQMCVIQPRTEATIRIYYVVTWSKCKGIETGELWYIQRWPWPTGGKILEKPWRIYRNHYARKDYREGELNTFSSLWNTVLNMQCAFTSLWIFSCFSTYLNTLVLLSTWKMPIHPSKSDWSDTMYH